MHRAALSFCGLDGTYDLIDIAPQDLYTRMPELLQTYTGLNVTVPHKQAVLPLVAELTRTATVVGAVNTLRCAKGQTVGDNTDVDGFARALASFLAAPLNQLRTVCVTGSGGAARAAVYALLSTGVSDIVLVARNSQQAKQLLSDLDASAALAMTPEEISGHFALRGEVDLLVNCIPFGLTAAVPAWYEALLERVATLNSAVALYDMVYTRDRSPTALCDTAARYDITCSDGLQMLIEQAVLAFEFWTGRQVPASVMTEAALSC